MVTSSTTHRLPRIVVAAPASGHGKTTLACGLMAGLRRRGLAVAPAKVGPDYIDPGYHWLAADRVGRNLDPVLVGEDRIVPLLLHGAAHPDPADVAVIEGVMGLFDGRLGTDGDGSTAHVARLTDSPVLLVVDVRHASRTFGAVVHGLATYDPRVRVGGVLLNRVGSARHGEEVRRAVEAAGLPVLGALPRDEAISAPSRHLGLVPAAERAESAAVLEALADRIAADVDLEAILALAGSAPDLSGDPWDPVAEMAGGAGAEMAGGAGAEMAGGAAVEMPVGGAAQGEGVGRSRSVPGTAPSPDASGAFGSQGPAPAGRPVIAVAGGRAFTFRYAETEELLRAGGCDVVTFDPLTDDRLPEGTAGLYVGGGFPQVHAADLSANAALRCHVRDAIGAGLPTVAECAGLLYLCESVDGTPMTGALPLLGAMTPQLTLGYRDAIAGADTLLARAGERVRAHEFHRTAVGPLDGPAGWGEDHADPAWDLDPAWLLHGGPDGVSADPAGAGRPSVHASYLHLHWAGYPRLARRFVAAAHEFAASGGLPGPASSSVRGDESTGRVQAPGDAASAHAPVAGAASAHAPVAGAAPVGAVPVGAVPVGDIAVGQVPDGELGVGVAPVEAAVGEVPVGEVPLGEVTVGEVILVGGGPGDPGLLTVAGLAAIREADAVVYDRLAPLASLAEAPRGAELIEVGKIPRGAFTPQERINEILVEQALAGRRVVRLKGGDSFVFGRGGEEWQACAAAGIPVRVIPGVTSSVAVPELAGIPVTHRHLTQGFTVVSGHVPPGDSRSTLDWDALARANTTLVILMGVKYLPEITARLTAAGLDPATPAVVVEDGCSADARSLGGTVADIAALAIGAGVRPPAITVIGQVAGLDLGVTRLGAS